MDLKILNDAIYGAIKDTTDTISGAVATVAEYVDPSLAKYIDNPKGENLLSNESRKDMILEYIEPSKPGISFYTISNDPTSTLLGNSYVSIFFDNNELEIKSSVIIEPNYYFLAESKGENIEIKGDLIIKNNKEYDLNSQPNILEKKESTIDKLGSVYLTINYRQDTEDNKQNSSYFVINFQQNESKPQIWGLYRKINIGNDLTKINSNDITITGIKISYRMSFYNKINNKTEIVRYDMSNYNFTNFILKQFSKTLKEGEKKLEPVEKIVLPNSPESENTKPVNLNTLKISMTESDQQKKEEEIKNSNPDELFSNIENFSSSNIKSSIHTLTIYIISFLSLIGTMFIIYYLYKVLILKQNVDIFCEIRTEELLKKNLP